MGRGGSGLSVYLEAYTVYVSHMDVAWGGTYACARMLHRFSYVVTTNKSCYILTCRGRARVYSLEPTEHWMQNGGDVVPVRIGDKMPRPSSIP